MTAPSGHSQHSEHFDARYRADDVLRALRPLSPLRENMPIILMPPPYRMYVMAYRAEHFDDDDAHYIYGL